MIVDNIKTTYTSLTSSLEFLISSGVFFTVRYAENIHLYFWLFKDLAWSLRYTDFGMTFGTIAVIWLGVLYYNAIKTWSTEEIYFLIPTTLWLMGNYLWMMGELENNDDAIYRPQGRNCMIAGIVIVVVYHILVKWTKWLTLTSNEKAEQLYNENGLKSRFAYFSTFRQYEHFHMFCWLGKDLCWNANIQVLWCAFVLPTFFISADFIYLSAKNSKMIFDNAHYISQFIWVIANILWAYQELFLLNMSDKPQYLPHPNDHTFRWASSLLLVLAWIPIGILYFVWLPYVAIKKIKTNGHVEIKSDIELQIETYQHPDILKKFPQNDFQDDEVEL